MTRARFVLTLPEGGWLGTLSREWPAATVELLTAIRGERGSVGVLWITSPNVKRVLDAVADLAAVTERSVFHRTTGEAAVGFDADQLLPFDAASEAGVPVDPPVEISDGDATVDVIGLPGRISALGQVLDARSIAYRIAFLSEDVSIRTRLTQKQRTLVLEAIDRGYYDTPRTCSLTELAEAMGLAKSTISETLHRAEEVLVKEGLRTPGDLESPVSQ